VVVEKATDENCSFFCIVMNVDQPTNFPDHEKVSRIAILWSVFSSFVISYKTAYLCINNTHFVEYSLTSIDSNKYRPLFHSHSHSFLTL
jgi:hypothetical protein